MTRPAKGRPSAGGRGPAGPRVWAPSCRRSSGFFRRPAGLVGFGLLDLGLIARLLRWSLDRGLRTWVVAHGVGLTLLLPFYVLSVTLPLIRIQPALGK